MSERCGKNAVVKKKGLQPVASRATVSRPEGSTPAGRPFGTSITPSVAEPVVYVAAEDAQKWLSGRTEKADLIVIDPPYYGIVSDDWDNQWTCEDDYANWLVACLDRAFLSLNARGSLLMFAGLGRQGSHPIFNVLRQAERIWTFRNWITWQKRRAYGKSHDYLYCREEILWLSKSAERTEVTFSIPLLAQKRGYDGWDKKHPAKSEFKRVSNVWTDIPELMRPERTAQKPVALLDRIIRTHSNEGDLVVDCFAGWGTTGVSALSNGRRFAGCEADAVAAAQANKRCEEAARVWAAKGTKQ